MKQKKMWLVAITVAMMFTGCISKKEFQALQSENNALKSENVSLREESNSCRLQLTESNASVKSLQDLLDAEKKRNAELKQAYKDLQGSLDKSLQQNSQGNVNISKLVDEINASNRFIRIDHI